MVLALALLLAPAALAQDATAPTVEVALDPEGEITVGTPVTVRLTVLVPTYMPEPPVWPDLQIADAITRLPESATHPVSRRVGQATLSGVTRTYEITPQRPAEFDLSGATLTVTYADPDTNDPLEATLPVPDIAVTATVPPGAEGLDPFLAAQSLTLVASLDDLPDAPQPGDAFTLTLTTTAAGTPAMLLPPLLDRLPVPEGLRAYPREPALSDAPGERGAPPTATRIEQTAYVIETPGTYTLPSASLSWWNTEAGAVETAATDPVTFTAEGPPAMPDATASPGRRAALAAAAAVLALAGLLLLWRMRRSPAEAPRPPSEARLYRELTHAVQREPVAAIRQRLAAWLTAAGQGSSAGPTVDAALLALERTRYGPPAGPSGRAPDRLLRRALVSALDLRRRAALARPVTVDGPLPPLNPFPTATQ